MPYDAILFDLDGTLIDSSRAIRTAMLAVCGQLALPEPDLDTVKTFVGGGVTVAMARLLEWAGADPKLRPEAVSVMRDAYEKVPADLNEALPGAHALLRLLAERGVPMGLCTNKPTAPTAIVVEGLGLGPFAATITGDDLPLRKPDPAPVRACCARMRVLPARCLFVGDSEIDHAAAAACPMPFAFVEGGYLNAPLHAPAPAMRVPDLHALAERLSAA